eukprot:1868352-Pyramimonas_sp.AAC.1
MVRYYEPRQHAGGVAVVRWDAVFGRVPRDNSDRISPGMGIYNYNSQRAQVGRRWVRRVGCGTGGSKERFVAGKSGGLRGREVRVGGADG